MTLGPRRHGRPKYNENDATDQVAVMDNDATALLQSHGLNVKRVTRAPAGNLTAEWRKQPTADDTSAVQALIEGIAHAT